MLGETQYILDDWFLLSLLQVAYNSLYKLDILEKFAGYYSFVTQYSIILGSGSDINIVNESMLRSYCEYLHIFESANSYKHCLIFEFFLLEETRQAIDWTVR